MTQPSATTSCVLREHRPPNRLARTLNRVTSPYSGGPGFHRWLYRMTDGRLGHGLIGAPTLLLHTTGRRSGLRRTTPVVYVYDRGRIAIAATNGGKGNPAWFHNLSADPRVDLQLGRQHVSATAHVLPPSDPDHEALSERLDAVTHGRLSAYRAQSGLPIPLIVLDPN
jgi:deazaflavin-dependent oxidoreductase (nitroreductase family)